MSHSYFSIIVTVFEFTWGSNDREIGPLDKCRKFGNFRGNFGVLKPQSHLLKTSDEQLCVSICRAL